MSIAHRKLNVRHTAATPRAYAHLFRHASLLWILYTPHQNIRMRSVNCTYHYTSQSFRLREIIHVRTYVHKCACGCYPVQLRSCLTEHNACQLEPVSYMSLHSPIMVRVFKSLW